MHHFIPRNWPEFVSATCRQIYWDFISFDIAEHELEWVGLYEMRRLHRLSITGIYARIGLGLQLSRTCTNKSDWLIRGLWIMGMQLNERPNPLRIAERLSPSKQLTCAGWSVSSLGAMAILLVLSCGGSCIPCSWVPSIESESDCGSRSRRFDSGPATYRLLKLIMRIFPLIEKGSCQMFNLSAQE